jgi:hypothetical protein
LNDIAPAKAKLEKHVSRRPVIGCVPSSEALKTNVVDAKLHHGFRGLRRITLAPTRLIEPISELTFPLTDFIDIDYSYYPSP